MLARRTTTRSKQVEAALAAADAASWWCALTLVALFLVVASLRPSPAATPRMTEGEEMISAAAFSMAAAACDEIYLVREGETLHSISDKCGDPFIVERNPHIYDPDDLFPGLVIKLEPSPEHHRHRHFIA